MIGRLNHVAIVVPDLAAAAATYAEVLGATISAPMELPDHGITTIFVELPNCKIELLHPLGDNSPITKFLERNPDGGMHHLCYEVEDITAASKHLVAQGAKVVDLDGPLLLAEDREPHLEVRGSQVLPPTAALWG